MSETNGIDNPFFLRLLFSRLYIIYFFDQMATDVLMHEAGLITDKAYDELETTIHMAPIALLYVQLERINRGWQESPTTMPKFAADYDFRITNWFVRACFHTTMIESLKWTVKYEKRHMYGDTLAWMVVFRKHGKPGGEPQKCR